MLAECGPVAVNGQVSVDENICETLACLETVMGLLSASFRACLGLKQSLAFILPPPPGPLFTLRSVSNFKVAKSLTTSHC